MIGLPLGIEVLSALASAHGQPGQAVLEGLFEGEQLEYAFGDAGMETNTAFVRADRIIVLHPPAALHADIAFIIFPTDAKTDDAIRFGDPPQNLILVIILFVAYEIEHAFCDFLYCLNKFQLTRNAFSTP